MSDSAYTSYSFCPPALSHGYGDGVYLSSDPLLLTELAELSDHTTVQPRITELVRELYQSLLRTVLAHTLPRRHAEIETRMHSLTPRGVWHGQVIDTTAKMVSVSIARAGTLPSQVAFELGCRLLDSAGVRQDHLYMNRRTDSEGRVIGVDIAGSKIGGDVTDALVLFPDPMGATGGSISEAMTIYRGLEGGASAKLISVNLIITPEYIARIRKDHPDALIYALRLDRGMSDPDVLSGPLGTPNTQESGLNEIQYIVPGAGGLGEILNNSFV